MTDGRATEAHYDLRPHPRSCVTFQRKIYVTQKLADVLNFVDDLLGLMSQIAEQHPVLELPEDTADTEEGNRKKIWPFVGRRTKGKRRGVSALRNSAGVSVTSTKGKLEVLKRHYQQLGTCSVDTAFDDSWKEEVDKKV